MTKVNIIIWYFSYDKKNKKLCSRKEAARCVCL